MTQEKIIQELAIIGFARPKHFMRWDNQGIEIYDSDDLDLDADAAIKKLKRTNNKYGGNVSIEFHGKVESLELLAKLLGLSNKAGNQDDPPFDMEVIRVAMARIKRE